MIIALAVLGYLLIGLVVLYRLACPEAKRIGDPDTSTSSLLRTPSTWLVPLLWPTALVVRIAAYMAAEPLNSLAVGARPEGTRPAEDIETSVALESAALGAAMLDNAAIPEMCRVLNERMFQSDAHRTVFAEIRRLQAEGHPAGLDRVREALERKGLLATVGGEGFLQSCVDGTPTAEHAFEYALAIRDRWARDGFGMSRLWRRWVR